MAESFTPGPWEPRKTTSACDIIMAGKTKLAKLHFKGIGSDAQHCNARLMAAAPDLLDALTLALPYVETSEFDEFYKPGSVAEVVNQIRAAIAKATGETL